MKNLWRRFGLFIIIILIASNPYNVQAHWDNDVWIENERQEVTDWESALELECFLALDHAPVVLIAGPDGLVRLDGQCEDVAFQLRDRAAVWGRRLETEILTKHEFREYYRISIPCYHMINKAIIGNEIWFVDKSWDDKMWHVGYLD